MLDLIHELYSLRTCRHAITPEYVAKGKGRLCLDYHIKRCSGPCVGKVSAEEYGRQIEEIRQILVGDLSKLQRHLKDEMESYASRLMFEQAHVSKLKLQLVERYTAKSVIVSQTIEDIDVFGIDDDGSDVVFINYMHVRNGAVVRSVTLEYRRRLDESAEQLLGYALAQIHEDFGVDYKEVVAESLPDVVPDGATFTVPQRGDKAKLLDVSRRNARQYRVDLLKHMERHDPEQRPRVCLSG